ncbi:helix-turn-helix transcriptional regulator [Halodesulfovibrio aestuarii]|uniref:DNA binding domain-containing protein, excisionase family n=1 Tax=Halodesulfovibrio aestuarii TaxID=126333 RepID=A0A8G2CC89_9BACT|nr:helix-turn-helix transcriptional regulator [Halodesulfovibrio aestuarii]SHJ74534.1 DNA binding domain-containing protein, excisionase family [Halodesulfovibrio aestuarii]
MKKLLSTKEVAQYLGVNEKMVYTLISEKSLPATKATGKWLFPTHLVEQWVEARTMNFPEQVQHSSVMEKTLIIAGSNDMLVDYAMKLYMQKNEGLYAAFCNLGSLGGIRAVHNGAAHIATSHLMDRDDSDYNFSFTQNEMQEPPAVVNFSFREQGYIIAKGNPKKIKGTKDIASGNITVVNRSSGTGTRLLFDAELAAAGAEGKTIPGYDNCVARHIDVGFEVISGNADAGLGIRAVAQALQLDFIPVQWERYDLIIPKSHYFDKNIQAFISLLRDPQIITHAEKLGGYDLTRSTSVIYPGEAGIPE